MYEQELELQLDIKDVPQCLEAVAEAVAGAEAVVVVAVGVAQW